MPADHHDPAIHTKADHDLGHDLGPGPEPDPRFAFLGGRLAVDLVNTVSHWHSEAELASLGRSQRFDQEKLERYADVLAWVRSAGALSATDAEALARRADDAPADAEAVLERARAFRLALHDLLIASIEGAPPAPADLAVVNAELGAQLASATLVFAPQAYALTRTDLETAHPALDAVLWPVARSALRLLTEPADLAKVRVCAADDCGWMFLDTSGGRRRWCSMADCGNAAKVRRFRSRQKSKTDRRTDG